VKWIELLKVVDGHEAGKFIEVEDHIARSYIDAGLAKDGGDGPDTILLQRALDKFGDKMKGFVTETAKKIEEATAAVALRPIVRGGDGGSGWEFNGELRAGESEADKSKSIGDFMRTAYLALSSAMTGDYETAQAGHKRMTEVYGVKRNGGQGDALIQRNMTESAGSSLGYTTPVIYESQILRVAGESQVFLPGARKVPLAGRQVEWPALNQFRAPAKGQSSAYGGVQVYRKGEASQRTVTDAAMTKVTLMAQDLTAMFELSRNSLEDSTALLDALIPELGGGAIGWRADWEAFQGTGNGQMLGITNAPATILVTRASANHITYPDVFKMWVRMLPGSDPVWYCHPFAFADIMQLKDDSGRNIFLPVIPGSQTGPIAQRPVGTLLGVPIILSEKMFPLGTPGDLGLFAMDRYLHGERQGLEVGLSEHFLFDTDQVAIRLKVRNDGKPQLKGPIYLADGTQSNQVSAFVLLQ